jgi:hypothetical protein
VKNLSTADVTGRRSQKRIEAQANHVEQLLPFFYIAYYLIASYHISDARNTNAF